MSQNKITIEKILNVVDFMNNLDLDEKAILRKNCDYAIKQMGDDWLNNENSKNHPLWGFFGISTGVYQLGVLGSALKGLQSKDNFQDILNRLRNPDNFVGAQSEILVGNWLNNSGIPFEFLKPKKKSKSSDLIVSSSERNFIMEITTKDYPEDYLKVFQNQRKISVFLLNNLKGLNIHLKNVRPLLSSKTTEEILTKLKETIEKAEIYGFEVFNLPKVIRVYIFRQENQERIPLNDRVFIFKNPKSDEFVRVRGTIKEKAKQLPDDLPGVLLIFDSFFWPSKKIEKFTSKLQHELEEIIFEYPSLSAVVIITQFADTAEDYQNIIKKNESSISMKIYNPKSLLTTYKFVLFNKYARFPLSWDEREMLKKI